MDQALAQAEACLQRGQLSRATAILERSVAGE